MVAKKKGIDGAAYFWRRKKYIVVTAQYKMISDFNKKYEE
jgi:hypothetical protein